MNDSPVAAALRVLLRVGVVRVRHLQRRGQGCVLLVPKAQTTGAAWCRAVTGTVSARLRDATTPLPRVSRLPAAPPVPEDHARPQPDPTRKPLVNVADRCCCMGS